MSDEVSNGTMALAHACREYLRAIEGDRIPVSIKEWIERAAFTIPTPHGLLRVVTVDGLLDALAAVPDDNALCMCGHPRGKHNAVLCRGDQFCGCQNFRDAVGMHG